MNMNQIVLLSFSSLLPMLTINPSYAACCYPKTKPSCSLASAIKIRPYVDLSLGQSLKNHMDNGNFNLINNGRTKDTITLTARQFGLTNLARLETGLMCSAPYPTTFTFFPFISVGLAYQHANLNDNDTLMELNIDEFTRANIAISDTKLDAYYTISRDSLLANFQLGLLRWHRLLPYASVGIGTTRQYVKQKEAFSLPSIEKSKFFRILTTDDISNKFTYIVGAGVDFTITENFLLGLNYTSQHFADIKLNPSLKALSKEAEERTEIFNPLLKPIKLKKISTQTLQLTGRYLFG